MYTEISHFPTDLTRVGYNLTNRGGGGMDVLWEWNMACWEIPHLVWRFPIVPMLSVFKNPLPFPCTGLWVVLFLYILVNKIPQPIMNKSRGLDNWSVSVSVWAVNVKLSMYTEYLSQLRSLVVDPNGWNQVMDNLGHPKNTAWVLYKNSLYKNLRGSVPRWAIYFQLYQTHSTLRIWGTLESDCQILKLLLIRDPLHWRLRN